MDIENINKSVLLPNRNYIIIRRFSPKEDIQRIVAAPYISSKYHYQYIGIENRLNYLYRESGEFTIEEMYDICKQLNSDKVNKYFKTISGSVNISATELSEIRI